MHREDLGPVLATVCNARERNRRRRVIHRVCEHSLPFNVPRSKPSHQVTLTGATIRKCGECFARIEHGGPVAIDRSIRATMVNHVRLDVLKHFVERLQVLNFILPHPVDPVLFPRRLRRS